VGEGDARPRVVRHDVFDLVPRRTGTLRVAPLRIAWLDPADGRYRVARTEPIEIRVRPAPADEATDATDRPTGADDGGTESIGRAVPWLAAAVLVVGGLAVGAARRRLRGRGDPARDALHRFDRAAGTAARAAALEEALRARLAERGETPTGPATQGGMERSPDPVGEECRRALAELERARFGGGGASADLDARLEAIRALVARSRPRRPRPR
jgi:hypothetical protein